MSVTGRAFATRCAVQGAVAALVIARLGRLADLTARWLYRRAERQMGHATLLAMHASAPSTTALRRFQP